MKYTIIICKHYIVDHVHYQFFFLSLGRKLTCTTKTSFFKGNVFLLGLATVTGFKLPGEANLTEPSLLVLISEERCCTYMLLYR